MKLRKNISPKPAMLRKVGVAPYNPKWPKGFAKEAANLKKIFRGELLEIHHIGSTSIPGMDAKTTIDILMVVLDIKEIDRFNQEMQCAGYIPKGENGNPGRRFFVKGDELHHTHHHHIFQKGHMEIARHLSFRDYMIAHPEEAKEYALLKKELANRNPLAIDSYQSGKDQFIHNIDQKAKAWRVY
jgi:GrpB-like predicted nucleotidyltransferase (UPF0157 family)